MKTPVIALALAILIVSPAFTQSVIEAPRTKICDGTQSQDHSSAYPSYPTTWCYWW
jgi:hypothetical protein